MNRLNLAFALLSCAFLTLPAEAKDQDDDVILVRVDRNDPANPAILDTKGQFVTQFLLAAEKTWSPGDQGRAWFSAKLKPVLHKSEGVCESGSADIYETDRGKLIVKFLKFYDAQREQSDSLSCVIIGRPDTVIAPTVDHYLAARWAVEAIKPPLRSAWGTKDDPFCQPRSFERCPTKEELESYLATAKAFWAKSCGAIPSDCVFVRIYFYVRENGNLLRIIDRDFRIEYQREKSGRKLKGYSFNISPPPAPASPGPPRVIGNQN